MSEAVADSDLQIRRRGGDGHPDPQVRGGGLVPPNFFGLKIRGPSPGFATEEISLKKRHSMLPQKVLKS